MTRRGAAAVCAAVVAFSVFSTVQAPAEPSTVRGSAPEGDLNCSEGLIEKTLANGSRWRMCARIHPLKGLVLEQIEYRPPSDREYTGYLRVLDQLSLAQLNVPYDNGEVQYNDITSYGFGDEHLLPQNNQTCLGDLRDVSQTFLYRGELITRTIPGICLDEVDTGLSTHSYENDSLPGIRFTGQGTALTVSSLSKISWYEYQQRIVFDDQGQLDVGLGATGDVAPGGPGGTMFSTSPDHGWPLGGEELGEEATFAASHWHNAIWKVDFGIDRGSRQFVEQWDYENSASGSSLPQLTGVATRRTQAFHVTPSTGLANTRWLRVVNPDSLNADGHPRSYEIVNRNTPHSEIPIYAPTLSFTNANECQEYASMNVNPGCPNASVLDYVEDDAEELTDPVAWVNVGFHHIDRDEDQSPMPVHWQSFQLVPRDAFAQSVNTPDERVCINGAGWIDSEASSCKATNTTPPTIRASGSHVGAELRAEPGSWNEARTTWNYSYLWFRNGRPIMIDSNTAATSAQYVLRPEDQGTRITAKVTASQLGFASGTAETLPLSIPAAPIVRARSSIRVRTEPVRVGRRPTLVVLVTAASGVVEGRVTIKRNGKVLRTGLLRKGKVTLRIRAFRTPGRPRVRVSYGGSPTAKPTNLKVAIRVIRNPR